MAKRKKKVPKKGPVWKMSSVAATLSAMPRYNGYICRGGAHGDAKYNRTREKRAFAKEMRREEASGRRPLRLRGTCLAAR